MGWQRSACAVYASSFCVYAYHDGVLLSLIVFAACDIIENGGDSIKTVIVL